MYNTQLSQPRPARRAVCRTEAPRCDRIGVESISGTSIPQSPLRRSSTSYCRIGRRVGDRQVFFHRTSRGCPRAKADDELSRIALREPITSSARRGPLILGERSRQTAAVTFEDRSSPTCLACPWHGEVCWERRVLPFPLEGKEETTPVGLVGTRVGLSP